MGISQYDPAARGRPAWNAGRQVGAKRALKVRQIWAIRFFLDREGRMRDRALFGRVPGRGVTEVVKPLASAPLGAP